MVNSQFFFFFQAQCGGMPGQRWRSSGLVDFMYAAHRAVTQRPIGEGDGWHGGKRQRFSRRSPERGHVVGIIGDGTLVSTWTATS